ncbi:aminotransferase class III-fold pyridoxal phosphate-dependent enzyme [Alphaproteobacteria bacterium]|nr:aminotransferase class III-fold pyridoxal phosphate-dependent enzyme [Alphaproteobacteria bacterium]
MSYTTLDDLNQLSINDIHLGFKNYINPGQVNLLASFGAGQARPISASGLNVKLNDGRVIKDFTGGIGVLNLGHNHEDIVNAQLEYMKSGAMEVHKSFFNPALPLLSQKLIEMSGIEAAKVYLSNSGAEAVECALKLCFKYFKGKRHAAITANDAFHGKLLGAGGFTTSPEKNFSFPTIPGIYRVDFNETAQQVTNALEGLRVSSTSEHGGLYCVLLEAFSASNCKARNKDVLRAVRVFCDDNRIPLIFDEVYTGLGKTGANFSFSDLDILPDVLCVSKSLGGGKSTLAAVVAADYLFDGAYGKSLSDSLIHSSTFNAFGIECFTALRSLEILEKFKLVARSKEIGQKFSKWANDFVPNSKLVSEVRGSGCLYGLVFDKQYLSIVSPFLRYIPAKTLSDPRFIDKLIASSVSNYLFNKHDILTYFGLNQQIPLKFAPSLVATDDDVDLFCNAIVQAEKVGVTSLVADFIASRLGFKSV